jgi:integrase
VNNQQSRDLLTWFQSVYVPKHLNAQSAKAIGSAVRRFLDFIGKPISIDEPTPETLARFQEWLVKGLQVEPVTAGSYTRHMRMILRAARPKDFPYLPRSRRVTPKRAPESERSLDYVLHAYCQEHPLRVASVEQLEFAVGALSKHLGRRATLDDLNHETINAWLVKGAESVSPRTLKGRRASILTLWRWAYDEAGLIWNPPRRVRRIKVPYKFPESFTASELSRLLAAAEMMAGRLKCGTSIRAFWVAWINMAYDTALRPCDLLVVRRDAVGDDCAVTIVQEKTGAPIVAHVRPETLAAIKRLRVPPAESIFRALQTKHGIYFHWGRLLRAAGLKGTPKKLRKTSATLLECVSPGSAGAHLGHRTPGLAAKHYIDPRIVASNKPLPHRIDRKGITRSRRTTIAATERLQAKQIK